MKLATMHRCILSGLAIGVFVCIVPVKIVNAQILPNWSDDLAVQCEIVSNGRVDFESAAATAGQPVNGGNGGQVEVHTGVQVDVGTGADGLLMSDTVRIGEPGKATTKNYIQVGSAA